MATYASNRDSGGLTDEEGHFKFWSMTYSGNVLVGQNIIQNSSTNMNVRVVEGLIRIPYSDYAYMAWSEGYTLVPITTADPSNPRIDRIIAYIDRSMTFTTSDINNPGILKYKAVAGTPNAVPAKASDAAVTSSVGASNPWVELATVSVTTGLAAILDTHITDTRVLAGLASNISANHITPVGTVNSFAGSTAPTGWLLCYGQAISRKDYKDLFAIIGTTYGVGDSSTTFNLPDCRGRVAAGKDNMGGSSANRLTAPATTGSIDGDVLGQTGGEEAHAQTLAEMAVHNHASVAPAAGFDNNVVVGGSWASPAGLVQGSNAFRVVTAPRTSAEGSGTAHNNVQPTIIFNKIIKF